ncbi:antibiotic biosynthesis monooxygenase family protein [Actinopolyspora saharensis]|uniref:Antibiotic biosynthesis monooxygenase n=1 Tax=Actinopolyspora saharensis TaxID=995062 RepID=A0A1H1EQZ3_9ACTN|nr:antibiotic biosynthesis monooxygenase family protein [Actinopolyspora saharensis]SDQ91171.1 Antibiotic biosynthesis monooxygenase [Actinopolyspora saharensis]
MPDTTITARTQLATLINVFTVEPEHQHELVTVLNTATEQVMRHLPGFVSASVHASTDGTRVVNYAQWESTEAYEAMLTDPSAREHMARAAEIATRFAPTSTPWTPCTTDEDSRTCPVRSSASNTADPLDHVTGVAPSGTA